MLTHVRALEVRPSTMTRNYVSSNLDPQQVGNELRVSTVLTGHFLRQGDQLLVTLEAIDVGSERLLWQANLTASLNELVPFQSQLDTRIHLDLLPVLGVQRDVVDTSTHPKNPEAYDLYLRSLPIAHDPRPNKKAIAMLERSTMLDPNFADSWEQLGLRYYYEATYSDGGEDAFQRSNIANEQALARDPNRILAAGQLIANRVGRGELTEAYAQAKELVSRRPGSAQAHFTLSYVLRYAGMLDQSAQECDTAYGLDSANYLFRSCAWTFLEMGNAARAMDFVRMDPGSEWTSFATVNSLLRQGRLEEARRTIKRVALNANDHPDFINACVLRAGMPLDKLATQVEASLKKEPDPELLYQLGALMGFCGERTIGFRVIARAVAQNYCAYSALQLDPLLVKMRELPEFSRLLSMASDCQKNVLQSARSN